MATLTLTPGTLTLAQLREIAAGGVEIMLDPKAIAAIDAAAATVQRVAAGEDAVYGINTGFGLLARTRIDKAQLHTLQRNLVESHATGVGPPLDDRIVRVVLALKLNALARGHSGVRLAVVEALRALLNADVLPLVPSQGSVGASGDLAPLAHLSRVLLGEGAVRIDGETRHARDGLAHAGIEPLVLEAKEGLALLNGTQVSTALAAEALARLRDTFAGALVAGALSLDAAMGSTTPFDPRIQALTGRAEQADVAAALDALLRGSAIRQSHVNCDRVQDPYSLRCQPQVMGACLGLLRQAAASLQAEVNAVSDNPLVFADTGEVLSGGNFHGQAIAFAADMLALATAEIGTMSERRVAMLVDPHMSSGLPAFLVSDGGLNSGFMLAQVTAAALVAENRQMAHPASIDSIPTSASQEDHVSMATHAARRLHPMIDNLARIVAVELLAGAQGVAFRQPLATSPALLDAVAAVRRHSPAFESDRSLAADIEAVGRDVAAGAFRALVEPLVSTLFV